MSYRKGKRSDKKKNRIRIASDNEAPDGDARETIPPADSASSKIPLTLDLDRSVVVRITLLANQITSSGSLTYQKRHGLTSSEWKVMSVVAAMPKISGTDITQVLNIDKASISRTVRTLLDRNLLVVEPKNPRGKQRAITLSERGHELHRHALRTAIERERCLLLGMTPAEQEQLRKLLGLMSRRMTHVFHLAEMPLGAFVADAKLERHAIASQAARKSPPEQDLAALRERVARLESLLADVLLENSGLCGEG